MQQVTAFLKCLKILDGRYFGDRMSVATIDECIQIIITAGGETLLPAKLLAAARAGLAISSIDNAESDTLTVNQAYVTIAAACRNGLPGEEKKSIEAVELKALDKEHTSVYDPVYRDRIRDYIADRISSIESNEQYRLNTQAYFNHQHDITEEFGRLLFKAHGASFRLEDKVKTPSAPAENKADKADLEEMPGWAQWLVNACIKGVSSEEFWAALIAGTSAMSSYAFAYEYYKQHGLGLGTGEDSPLRHIIGHVGGVTSYIVYFTLLFYFDFKRIRSMVMQYNISNVRESLLRKLKTLFCIEKKYVFQREYFSPLVWFFAVFNFLTTFNSPFLSYMHIDVPVIREISMTGSFFSALLGNNHVVEKAYAKPLNSFISDRVMPWWHRRNGEVTKAEYIERARRERKRIHNYLESARKKIHQCNPEQLTALLRKARNEMREPLTRENLVSYLISLGNVKLNEEPSKIFLIPTNTADEELRELDLPPREALQQGLKNFFIKLGQGAVLFGAFYALSTCIRQGQESVKWILTSIYTNFDPTFMFVLGYFAGIPSIMVNMLIGYYAVMFVFNLLMNIRNHFKDNKAKNWFTDIASLIGITLIAIANTIPAYQVAVDHPELPGADKVLAFVAFCMSIFSVNNFFKDRTFENFDMIKNLNKLENGAEKEVDFVHLKLALEKEIERSQEIVDHTDDDMIRFYHKECTNSSSRESFAPFNMVRVF